MLQPVLTALCGFVGVLLGAVLQRVGQHRKFLSDSRYEAYLLFLRSLAGSGASQPGSDARWQAVAGMIEAKSRIALFGSQAVVRALSEFSAQHSRVNDENFEELSAVIALMRMDVGAGAIADLQMHIRGLLFEVGK